MSTADLFKTAGADRLMCVDLHTGQIQGFFDGPLDHLFALPLLAHYVGNRVDRQRLTISRLIDNSLALSREVRGLITDNEEQIEPALANITQVVDLLRARQDKLAQTVHNLATFARVFVDTIGSGPWFDSYLANVPDEVSTTGPER